MAKKRVAIVAGGYGSEYGISIKSAKNIFNIIDRDLFEPYFVEINNKAWTVLVRGEKVPIDQKNFSFQKKGKEIKFDFAYIMVHGSPGEDGILQKSFESIGLSHSACNSKVSRLTFNKYLCNHFLRKYNIISQISILVKANEDIDVKKIVKIIGLPCFVKPNASGSSFGISKVKERKDIPTALYEALKEGREVIVEESIDGREFSVGIYKIGRKVKILPISEIKSKTEFFDFDAKYNVDLVEEVTPAELPKGQGRELQELTKKIYETLGCNDLARAEYILKNKIFYFLEINTIPGMTDESIIPKQLTVAGIELKDLLTEIILKT